MKFKTPLQIPTGEVIAATRTKLGLTQADASERAYVSRPRWADYERGERPIDLGKWHLFLVRSGLLPADA